jgi:hypothetical protein
MTSRPLIVFTDDDGWSILAKKLVRNKFVSIDPYFVWTERTGFRTFLMAEKDGEEKLPPKQFSFVLELSENTDPEDLLKELNSKAAEIVIDVVAKYPDVAPNAVEAKFSIPNAFSELYSGHKKRKFVSARFDFSIPPDFPGKIEVMSQCMTAMLTCFRVLRAQLGFPLGPRVSQTPAQTLAPATEPEEKLISPVVIGMIENFIPFAHRSLRSNASLNPPESVVVDLWDQSLFRKSPSLWSAPSRFNYGSNLAQSAIRRSMTNAMIEQEVDEELCYSAHGGIDLYGVEKRFKRNVSHGSAVLTLAASTRTRPQDFGADEKLEFTSRERAAIPVVAVQFPGEQAQVTSGRWVAVNALDALCYIQTRSRALFQKNKGGEPPTVVVNMSYGAIAGAHDGTGMLESAMDEMCANDPDFGVVLSAGNYYEEDVHATLKITKETPGRFYIFVPPDKSFETFCEFWVPKKGAFQFTVEGPGASTMTVSLSDAPTKGLEFKEIVVQGNLIGSLIATESPAQSTKHRLVLLALAPTQMSRLRPYALSGVWKIHVSSSTAENPVEVRAWVERDDQTVGGYRPQATRFIEAEETLNDPQSYEMNLTHGYFRNKGYINPNDTVSSAASGAKTWKVAATIARVDPTYRGQRISRYSSAPSISNSLDYSAHSDVGIALPGLLVDGNLSGSLARVNGTSVAAPQVLRHLVNQVISGSSLTLIRGFKISVPTPRKPLVNREGAVTIPLP